MIGRSSILLPPEKPWCRWADDDHGSAGLSRARRFPDRAPRWVERALGAAAHVVVVGCWARLESWSWEPWFPTAALSPASTQCARMVCSSCCSHSFVIVESSMIGIAPLHSNVSLRPPLRCCQEIYPCSVFEICRVNK